ncbi:DUF488 family protein [Rhodococcus erythropolis]|uniref:DUF488 domain-containing protein n=1 Tax=Rhodococcus erythropolis TaxID=1833 RepID=UPI00294977DE|nr:DUF488 family protein [Rhodococcus erythropolis]MDV6276688.1 DUF488 family protein [Rhodococcus erythropolis]
MRPITFEWRAIPLFETAERRKGIKMTRRIITVERVYEPASECNAVRLLVDRLWPRGVKRENLQYDDWPKDLAPSPELRKWYGHDHTRFDTFKSRYIDELNASPVREYVERIAPASASQPASDARPVVLLTASKDLPYSHAQVLADYLAKIL